MALPLVGTVITAAIVSGAARLAVAALGFGVVTYVGADLMLESALGRIQSSIGAAGAVANFAGLMGLDQAVSILVGAMTVRVSLAPLKRMMLV